MANKKVLTVTIAILLIISTLSGGLLLVYTYSLRQASNEFEYLAKTFQNGQTKASKVHKKDPKQEPQFDEATEEEPEPEINIIFEDLYDKNNDITAWISIPGTGLNYPVMHTPEEPEYYLYRNFDKEYSVSGVPFMDGKSSLDSPTDNLLIHGHNMKNGSMFAQLLSYKDEAFLRDHPSIDFYTFEGKQTYDIVSVFPAAIYNNGKSRISYHDFINAKDQAEFDKYLADAKEISLFDTGVGAQYGDQLMTLSTCSYHTTNGRFVVIAKEREN